MLYLVTWDFNKENPYHYQQKRDALMERISRTTNTKDPGLDSACFISTPSTAEEVYAFLSANILDRNDRLIVAGIKDWWGLLGNETLQWIRSNS